MNDLGYILSLLRFAVLRNRSLPLVAVLGLLSVGIELVAMAALLPISVLASGAAVSAGDPVARMLRLLGAEPTIRSLLLFFSLVFMARIVTQLASQGLSLWIGKRVQAQLSSAAFAVVVDACSFRDIESRSIGHYISLSGDEASRAGQVVISLFQLLSSSALMALYFLAILRLSPPVAAAIAVFLVVNLAILAHAFRASHRLGRQHIEQSRTAHAIFLDALNNLRSVRAFGAERFVIDRYSGIIFTYTATLFMVDAIHLVAKLGPALILATAFALLTAARDPGAFAGFDVALSATVLVFVLRFFPVVGQGLNILLRIIADAKAGKDVTSFVEAAPAAETGATLDSPIRRIDIQGLAFAHPGRSPVLAAVDATFAAGRSYAIIGASGCGKSTLLGLLLRFHEPGGGSILVDGRSLAGINPRSLRRRMVLLAQQTMVFNETVAANIVLGAGATAAEIEAAAVSAGIHDAIRALPQGYGTVVAYQGANLSGGQRQRLGLARALLRRPDVLLLDESTGALDAETRDVVVGNVLAAYRERIVVFVTHDPAIISRVDEVIDLAAINRAAFRDEDSLEVRADP